MPIALIPARLGSQGIPGKNFELLDSVSPVSRAVTVCLAAGIQPHVSCNAPNPDKWPFWVRRPDELAQDYTPMREVIQHFLSVVPGPDDEIILLVQPTQPLREPKHLREALALMEKGAVSVASVVETESVQKLYTPSQANFLLPFAIPSERRQDSRPTYRADGTVYAFRRNHNFTAYPLAYHARALIIPSTESAALDTPLDWEIATLRLKARHAPTHRTTQADTPS